MTSTTACCGPKLGRETKVCAHLCFRLCRLILRCRNNMVDVSTTLARREYNPSTPSGGTSSRRTPRLPATQSRCAMIEYDPLPLHPALVPSGAPFAHACSLVMEGVSQPRFRWRRRGRSGGNAWPTISATGADASPQHPPCPNHLNRLPEAPV